MGLIGTALKSKFLSQSLGKVVKKVAKTVGKKQVKQAAIKQATRAIRTAPKKQLAIKQAVTALRTSVKVPNLTAKEAAKAGKARAAFLSQKIGKTVKTAIPKVKTLNEKVKTGLKAALSLAALGGVTGGIIGGMKKKKNKK